MAPGLSSAPRVQSGLPTTLEFLLQFPDPGLEVLVSDDVLPRFRVVPAQLSRAPTG